MLLKIACLLLCAGAVNAGVKEDIARAQKAAASGNKLVAFVFLQDYWDPGCPTCVAQVNAANEALKKLAPTKYARVVYLEPKELKKEGKDGTTGLEAVPECVREKQNASIMVTDADCSTVVARATHSTDKKKNREEEKLLNEACAAYLKTGKVADEGKDK